MSMPAQVPQNLSDPRMQELRRILENDYGKGSQATVIVRNPQGEIVMFISGGSSEELEKAIREYRSKQGS